MKLALASMLTLALLPLVPLQAQPVGPEFRVNTYTTGDQSQPRVAADATGRFVVAYNGRDSGASTGILARRFTAGGTPLTEEFVVNSETANTQSSAALAAAPDGKFVVVFRSFKADDDQGGLYARLFDAGGAPIGAEFRVNSYTTGVQNYPAVAMAADGGFLVAWSGVGDTDDVGVFGRRFDPGGVAVGNDIQINQYTPFDQRNPSVAVDTGGHFFVTWFGLGNESSSGFEVWGRAFGPSLAPLTPAFRVNQNTTGNDNSDAVAGLAGGGFVVVWQNSVFGTGDGSVFGQRFDGDGVPRGGPFRVNTYTTGYQLLPTVGGDASGGFLVAWRSQDQDGSGDGVYAQRFGAGGDPIGGELRVNTYTSGNQREASVAGLGPGRFAVVWTSASQDGHYGGVYAQRLWAPRGDVDGNGAVNVSDILYLINFLFAGGPPPIGPADNDGNGAVNVTDVLYLINYLFAGGPAPL